MSSFPTGDSSARICRTLFVGLIAGLIAATGCLPTARGGEDPPVLAADAAKQITTEESQQFANELSKAVAQGDFNTFNRMLDWDSIVSAATMVPNLPELQKARDGFKSGVQQGLKTSGGGLAGQICEIVKKGGEYKVLRADVSANETVVTFRLLTPDHQSLNYHRFYLKRNSSKQVVAADLFILLTAEKVSETLHRSWLPIAKAALKSSAARSDEATTDLLSSAERMRQFAEFVQAGKNADALNFYYKFPASLRSDKTMLILRFKAAQAISTDEQLQCIDDMQKFFPEDGAVAFVMVDAYLHRQQPAEALKCLDRVIGSIGPDAALLARRANILLAKKDLVEARKVLDEAIKLEPDLRDPYVVSLDVVLAAKDFYATASLLNLLTDKFGYQWKDLEQVAPFAEFVESPQYHKWLESRKK